MSSPLQEKLINTGAHPTSSIVKTYAKNKADAIQTAVLHSSGLESETKKREREKREHQREICVLLFHGMVASVSIILAMVTAEFDAHYIITYIAMGFPVILAPIVFIQRRCIARMGSLRKINNEMRGNIDTISREIQILSMERDRLEKHVNR